MFGFLKHIGGSISHAVSSVSKKVSGAVSSAVKVGKKVAGKVGSIANKVSSVSDAVSKGLAVAGGVAGAIGLEPVAGVLEAGAGVSKAISEGAKGVGAVASDVNKGLDKVQAVNQTARNIAGAVAGGNIQGAVSQAGTLKRQVQDVKTTAQTTTRNAIQRGKDVRQQVKQATSKGTAVAGL